MHDTSGVSKVKTIKRERVIAFIVSDILIASLKWLYQYNFKQLSPYAQIFRGRIPGSLETGMKKTATYRVTVFRLLFHLSGQKSVA